MEEKNEVPKMEAIVVHGAGSVRTFNETIYYSDTKMIDGDIYESVSYVLNNDTHQVIKITSWTKGEGENIEVVEMDGSPLKKEKLGIGEFVKNDDGSEDSFKLVLKEAPTN